MMVRRNRPAPFAAGFALVAMLLQLALSFGHLHAEEIFGAHGFSVDKAAGIRGASVDRGNGAAGHQDADLDHGVCPVCASMAMLGGSALPEAVALPIPSARRATASAPRTEAPQTALPRLGFQPRAPPNPVSA